MDGADEADSESPGKPLRRRGGARPHPQDSELFAAVVEMVSTGAAAFKSTARRYSMCSADAEDAYQRGLEILMTKAPTACRAELAPWLHTVIKHEALALRRQRERLLAADPAASDEIVPESVPSPAEDAAARERLRQTAEALRELKPSEIKCLLLKALGYSYDEIAARTGFSWTKVNRSLTEGRKRFFARFGQIESGERCERFAPLLSAASDGEAPPEEEHRLKAHLRSCSACRAALRSYRSAPTRLAQLLPPAILVPATQKGWGSRIYESLAVSGDRAAALAYKFQHSGEVLAAKKTAAVVASTAALAGGAVVHEQTSHQRHVPKHPSAQKQASASPRPQLPASPDVPAQGPPAPSESIAATGTTSKPAQPAPGRDENAAAEFTPDGSGAPESRPPAPPEPGLPAPGSVEPSARSSTAGIDAGPGGAAAGPPGAQEFGP
jgi:RNA polymerase sigma factor (sigma-70 family)